MSKRKLTSTSNLAEIIQDGMARIGESFSCEIVSQNEEATVHLIEAKKMKESIVFLGDTLFSDMVNWYYEPIDDGKDVYLIECEINSSCGVVKYMATLIRNKEVKPEDLKKALGKTIFNKLSA